MLVEGFGKGRAVLKFRFNIGFTLLEMMVVVAVLSIVLGLALPSFRTATQNNRITAQANELLTAFQFARSESLKRNLPVAVCASDDGAVCAGGWDGGWIVLVDSNAPGTPSVGTAGELVRVWPAPRGGTTISDGHGFYRFLPNGTVDSNAGAVVPGNLNMIIPNCRGNQARAIAIARSGRVTVERSDCP